MKKIIKSLSIVGLASSLAVASNFYVKENKKENIASKLEIDEVLESSNLENNQESEFKLTLGTDGNNIEINETATYPMTKTSETLIDSTENEISSNNNLENETILNDTSETDNNAYYETLTTDDTIKEENSTQFEISPSTDNNDIIEEQTDSEIVGEQEENSASEENSTDENENIETKIEANIEILTSVNNSLNDSLTQINELLDEIDVEDISDEDKENILQHINFINEKTYELINITNTLKCELTDCEQVETIESLTYRLNSLQHAIESIQTLNNQIASNYRFFSNPTANIYGYSYRLYPKLEYETQEDEEDSQATENTEAEENSDTLDINNKDIDSSAVNIANQNQEAKTTTTKTKNKNIDSYAKRGFTSNIDTYGPRRRNIDSFYNTAFLNEYGYNMPYYNNYPGNYGVNNFNNNYLGEPNSAFNNLNGANSNNGYINPEFIEKETNKETTVSQKNLNLDLENDANSNNPLPPQKTNPKRVKFAKNIDSYTGKTLNANINTMSGEKITDIIKSKFNKWFNKDKGAKKEIDNYVDNFIADNSTENNSNLTNQTDENSNNRNLNDIVSTNAKTHKTKDIKESDLFEEYVNNENISSNDINLSKDPITRKK